MLKPLVILVTASVLAACGRITASAAPQPAYEAVLDAYTPARARSLLEAEFDHRYFCGETHLDIHALEPTSDIWRFSFAGTYYENDGDHGTSAYDAAGDCDLKTLKVRLTKLAPK